MRSFMISLMLCCAGLATTAAHSAEVPYESKSFEMALTQGQPLAVVFHADWCPTCRAQAPVLQQLMMEPKRQSLTLFVADFDTEMALRKKLRVSKQSTIVVFSKGSEVARSTGDTQRDVLAALLSKASP